MEWSDQELDELATFFAKRMTIDLQPLDPSDPPPPGDPAAHWRTKLQAARDAGDLGRLAGRIADAAPGDANLQQACGLLTERGGRNARQVLGIALSVGVLLLGFGGVFAASQLGVRPAPVPLQPQAVVAAAQPTSIPDPMASRMVAGEGEVEVLGPPQVAVPAPVVDGKCGGEAGKVVGYWYAGEKKPGKKGKTVVMDSAVNVRADYPDAHNGFQKRAPVTCVLQPGDKVRLAENPIKVPGDAYWVPLVAGSVEAGKNS